jgi:hypothetical protein
MEWHYLFSGQEELVDKVILFFTAKSTNPELFQKIVAHCENNPLAAGNPNHAVFLKMGHLSLNDFLYYESASANQKGIPIGIVERILERLCQNFILSKEQFLLSGRHSPYRLNGEVAQFFYSRNLIKDVIFGFNYIVQKYQESIFKIVVKTGNKDSDRDFNIGTGFLLNWQTPDNTCWSVIITNEHVAKYEDGLQIIHRNNQVESWKKIVISPHHDLDLPSFHLSPDSKVLDEIVIVGYPRVPTAVDAYQLVHKGEINCFLTDFWKKDYFLFSAKTSPGNSGGPVINNMGMVAGVVTQQLFEQGAFEKNGQLPYFAAAPSPDILNFLNDSVFSQLK